MSLKMPSPTKNWPQNFVLTYLPTLPEWELFIACVNYFPEWAWQNCSTLWEIPNRWLNFFENWLSFEIVTAARSSKYLFYSVKHIWQIGSPLSLIRYRVDNTYYLDTKNVSQQGKGVFFTESSREYNHFWRNLCDNFVAKRTSKTIVLFVTEFSTSNIFFLHIF